MVQMRGNETDRPLSSSSLKDDGLAVEPEHLPVDVGDLTEAHVLLHRVHQDRHDVATGAASVRELLETTLHAAHVARGLEAPRPLDLLGLHPLVDAQVV